MADFKTHITTSSLLGVAYGAVGFLKYDVPGPTCLLAAGLCGVSGMLPDIDSDSGVPLRESLAFGSAVVPVMLTDRLQRLAISPSTIILIGAATYLLVRFGLGHVLKKYTVHRGMFHSLPAAAIFGLLAYLLAPGADTRIRWFQSAAVVVGFMSHLILDEIWALGLNTGRVRVKQSFGTALKFWGPSPWANVSTYGKLAVMTFLAIREPNFVQNVENGQLDQALTEMIQDNQAGTKANGPNAGKRPATGLQGMTGQVVRNVLGSLTGNPGATTAPSAVPPAVGGMTTGTASTAPVYALPQPGGLTPLTGNLAAPPVNGSSPAPSSGWRWPRSDIRIAPPRTGAPQDYSWSPPSASSPSPNTSSPSPAWATQGGTSWSTGDSGSSGSRIPPPTLSNPRW